MAKWSREAQNWGAKKKQGWCLPVFLAQAASQMPFPGFQLVSSGLRRKKRFGSRTPTDATVVGRACGPGRAPIGVRTSIGVPPRLWLRRPNATAQLQFRASRAGAFKRALPANRPATVQRCSSQTGRNAGRAEFPKLPECGLQVRPRVPHSPRAAACRPQRVRLIGEICPM